MLSQWKFHCKYSRYCIGTKQTKVCLVTTYFNPFLWRTICRYPSQQSRFYSAWILSVVHPSELKVSDMTQENGLKKNPYYMRHILYGIDNLLICYLDSAILQTLSDIYQALHILFFLKFNLDKLNNLLTMKFFVRRAKYFRIIVLRPLSFA